MMVENNDDNLSSIVTKLIDSFHIYKEENDAKVQNLQKEVDILVKANNLLRKNNASLQAKCDAIKQRLDNSDFIALEEKLRKRDPANPNPELETEIKERMNRIIEQCPMAFEEVGKTFIDQNPEKAKKLQQELNLENPDEGWSTGTKWAVAIGAIIVFGGAVYFIWPLAAAAFL